MWSTVLDLLGIFLSTWAFGSVGGTAYASGCGFSPLQTIVTIAVINALLVIIWFGIIGLIAMKFKRLLERYEVDVDGAPFLSGKKAETSTTVGLGLMAALTGSMWAVVAAHVMNVNKRVAWAVITPSAVTGGLIFTLGALGIIQFLPSPWWLYFVAVGVTVTLVARKAYRNREKITELIREIRARRSKIKAREFSKGSL